MHPFKLTAEQIEKIEALVEHARLETHQASHEGHWRRLQWHIDVWKDAYRQDTPITITGAKFKDPLFARKRAKVFIKAQEEAGKAISALEKIQSLGVSLSVPVSCSDTILIPDNTSPVEADPLVLLKTLIESYETARQQYANKDKKQGTKLPAVTREPLIALALWWREATGTFPKYSNSKNDHETSYGDFGVLLKILEDGQEIPVLQHIHRNKSAVRAAILEAKKRHGEQNNLPDEWYSWWVKNHPETGRE